MSIQYLTNGDSEALTTNVQSTPTSIIDAENAILDRRDLVSAILGAIPSSDPSETENALSVLISALPSDVAATILSNADSTSTQSGPPTTSATISETTSIPSTSAIPTTSGPQSTLQSTATPTTFSTITKSPTGTTVSAAHAATSSGVPQMPQPIKGASIAGIVTGILAAFVLAALAGLVLWQRKKKGQAPFSKKRGSQRSGRVYPEVAWLYDPQPSPPRDGSPEPDAEREHSGAALLPRPQEHEMAELSGGESPNLRPARVSSPLLAAHLPPPRDPSPADSERGLLRISEGHENRRGSEQSSSSDVRRPMTAIFESGQAQ